MTMSSIIVSENMPADAYHADPCEQPSLSASMAKVIWNQSMAHAHAYHPRLGNAGPAKESTKAMRSGSILHWLATGRDKPPIVIAGEYQSAIDRRKDIEAAKAAREIAVGAVYLPDDIDETPIKYYDAYRSKDAKAFKAEALARGLVPMKRAEYDDAIAKAQPMAEAFKRLNVDFTTGPRADGSVGYSELTIMHRIDTPEGGIWVRCRLDFVLVGENWIEAYDLKTTQKSARPDHVGKLLADQDAGIQRAAYTEALQVAFPHCAHHIGWQFVVIESTGHCGSSIGDCDPVEREIGEHAWRVAKNAWSRGVHRDEWPGYQPSQNGQFEAPSWREYQHRAMMGWEL